MITCIKSILMLPRCVCINSCRIDNYEFVVDKVYSYRNLIHYDNIPAEYSFYEYNKKGNYIGSYIGCVEMDFKKNNFIDFGPYIMLLKEVAKMYNDILWGI